MPTRRKASKQTPRRARRSPLNQLAGLIVGGALSVAEPTGVILDGLVSFDRRIARIGRRRSRIDDYIFPGFIDLQVNGAYGIDVMSAGVDDLLEMSHCLAHEGTTAWLPTVITSPLETIERVSNTIAEAMAAQAEIERATAKDGDARPVGAAILGMHLEGPFISPAQLGVHPGFNLLPQGEPLERVLQLKALKLITIAPELEGALDAIRMLRERGVAVSIGHSNATYEQTRAAVEAGACMFTHVFNAMRPLHHREPGVAGAALDLSRFRGPYVAMIPDGQHVHPAGLRFARRASGSFLTTDRVALTGTDGTSRPLFGGLVTGARVENGAARLADGTLAGSVVTMLDGVRIMRQHTALSEFSAAVMTSQTPARIIGAKDRGAIKPRARADLVVLNRDLKLKAVFIGGREID